MPNATPSLTVIHETTPPGVIGSLEAALEVAKLTPMVGCVVVLFDSDARCYQFRETSRRRRLETIGALQLMLHDLVQEHNE